MDAKTPPITVQTKIQASPKKVWEYWTKPEHIMNWNFASDEWICPKVENDLEVNGEFDYRMESKDGQAGFNLHGTYYNIIKEKLIEYKLDDSRAVSVEFTQNGDYVIITQTFEPEDKNSKDMQKNGWQAILNNFKKYVESKPV